MTQIKRFLFYLHNIKPSEHPKMCLSGRWWFFWDGFSLTLARSLTSASQLQFSVMTFPTFLNWGNNFIAWQETHDSLNICSRASLLQHSRECLPFTAFPTSRKIEYSLCCYLKEIIKTAVAAKVSEPEFMSNSHNNMTRSTILQSDGWGESAKLSGVPWGRPH